MGRVIGAVERGEVIDPVGEFEGPLRASRRTLEESPFEADARFEGVCRHAADSGRAPGLAAPRNRKMVDQFVVHVFDDAVDHLRFRGAGIGVVVEREAVIDERNVAVDLAGPVVKIGPQTEKLRLEPVVLLVLDLAAEIVEVVEHEVDTSEALVDPGVEMLYAAVRRGDGGLGVVRPFREHRAHGADVGELVHPPVGKRLVLLDVVGEALVGGEHAGLRFVEAGREGSGGGTRERNPVERAACGEQGRRQGEKCDVFFHDRNAIRI